MFFAADGETKLTNLRRMRCKELTKLRIRKLIPFLIIAILLWLPGCAGQSAQKPAKKPISTTQQKPAPPAQMKSMLTGQERLLENLQQQAKKEKLAAEQAAAEAKLKAEQAALAKQAQMEAIAKQKAAQEAQAKQKAKAEAQTKKQQPITPTTPTTPSPAAPPAPPNQQDQTAPSQTEPVLAQGSRDMAFWQQAAQSVQKLNQDWNALAPQASKAGMNTSQRNKIKKALDNLTAAVSAQNTEKSMLAAIELFGQSGSLAKVYMSPVPPEYFQLNYEIMMSAMEAEKMQWSAAESRIAKMQSAWSTVKAAAKGKNSSLINQTESSIRDYEQAIRGRQTGIVATKAEIALQNLKSVEEALTAMAAAATSQTGQ